MLPRKLKKNNIKTVVKPQPSEGEKLRTSRQTNSRGSPRSAGNDASVTPPSPLQETGTASNDPSGAALEELSTQPLHRLLGMRHPQQIASDLETSLASLRLRLVHLEMECLRCDGTAAGSTYAWRAKENKEKLELEVRKTEKMVRHLSMLGRVLDRIVDLRSEVFAVERSEMEKELNELENRVAENDEAIRQRCINRINLLHRYWVWRTLQELGDMTIGRTFEEELGRGPRYRSIAIQNKILSDTVEQQLHWLQRFSDREETFSSRLRQLERFVEEFTDINDALEEVFTCRVCGLLFEDPVVFWPCGHSFCLLCFDSLSVAPSLFRCSLCGSMGSEGYVHNLLLSESVAKWMFKDVCYADVHGALSLVRLHLSKFRKSAISSRIENLEQRLLAEREREMLSDSLSSMDIVTRAY
uniref:Uncharacterized protein TCIL3000_5_4900 n=1 Tax=Trypanosoma congolense (strain IL3000) TaxID=1068625 RepID=G0UM66_TRYCI|nr:unnamed protein product [Trypanosoma congolense IL3000]